jgi:tetratricopeptide (TPR) repeat protein
LPAIGIAWLGGLPILGFAACLILGPIAGYAPNILRVKKTPPMYARAIAKLKFGKYNEAELEIIRELEKCEDDFDGWMMLAELYARQFNDVNEAEQTVLEICDQPRTTPSQISVALHRLSEWHLNLADDPDRARRALQMICDRLPGTHLAHMAQLRIQQLPGTIEALHEMRHPKPIPVPAYNPRLAALRAASEAAQAKKEAAELANRCVETLTKDPNDVPAREELAHLLAEHLNQAEQGLEQITLLLNMPEQPAAKRAEWLSLAAAWQISHRGDFDTGRKILERVVREFPESPDALAARRRLQALDLEYRG